MSALLEIMGKPRRVRERNGVAFLNLRDTCYCSDGRSNGMDVKSKRRKFGLRASDKSRRLGTKRRHMQPIGITRGVSLVLAADRWVLRNAIIWHCTNGPPAVDRDRPYRTYESVSMVARNRTSHFAKDELPAKIEESLPSIPARPPLKGGLSTEPFPDELLKRCLKIGCRDGGTVLAPLVGTGKTIRTAVDSGRSGVGIALDRSNCRYAVRSLNTCV